MHRDVDFCFLVILMDSDSTYNFSTHFEPDSMAYDLVLNQLKIVYFDCGAKVLFELFDYRNHFSPIYWVLTSGE